MSNGPKGLGEDEEADIMDGSVESPVIASHYSSDHQPYSSDVQRRFSSFACRLRATIAHLFRRDPPPCPSGVRLGSSSVGEQKEAHGYVVFVGG